MDIKGALATSTARAEKTSHAIYQNELMRVFLKLFRVF